MWWKNISGKPCLTIFKTPNTSIITEGTIGRIVITKKQMNDSGYKDVRSVLEHVAGVDVYGDGPRGQKTSIFMRGTNSNHTLVLLNGIPINDQSSPKLCLTLATTFCKDYNKLRFIKELVVQFLDRQQ